MNSLAASLCDYLCSRNNDIAGYWGIGVLCAANRRLEPASLAFTIHPGKPLFLKGCEVTDSNRITDKLIKLQLDSIEGRLSFFAAGHYPDGTDKYICAVAIAVTQSGRTGMSMRHVDCWPHNPAREARRYTATAMRLTLLDRLRKLLR